MLFDKILTSHGSDFVLKPPNAKKFHLANSDYLVLSAIWAPNKSPMENSTKFASLYNFLKFYEKISHRNYAAHRQKWTCLQILEKI